MIMHIKAKNEYNGSQKQQPIDLFSMTYARFRDFQAGKIWTVISMTFQEPA